MPLDLTALNAAADRDTDVKNSAVNVITTLMAEVEAAKGDPVAIQAIVDRVNGSSDALATAIANTTGTPSVPGATSRQR
jgi:hypothetical protein